MFTAFETLLSELRPEYAEICSFMAVRRIVSRPIARPIPESSVSMDALTIRITLLTELRPDSAGRCVYRPGSARSLPEEEQEATGNMGGSVHSSCVHIPVRQRTSIVAYR